jgi:hypothetical protein
VPFKLLGPAPKTTTGVNLFALADTGNGRIQFSIKFLGLLEKNHCEIFRD